MYLISQFELSDRTQWESLYRQYAEFYEIEMPQSTLDTVWAWINDVSYPFYGVGIRTESNRLAGIAHYRSMPSPLRGRLIGFLDDLFIAPEFRGEGAVKQLFIHLRQECSSHGWPFVRWITKENNQRARAAYDKYASKTDWVTYQLEA